jgi:hypothetical protein
MEIPAEIPAEIDTALPSQVAPMLGTSEAGLAQMRYRGTGRASSSGDAASYTAGPMCGLTSMPTRVSAPTTPRGA